jgi:multiple antibiotic resistance protein
MLDTALTAFVTFFVIIDPIGVVPLFLGLTPDNTPVERRAIAIRAVVIAAIVLLVFTVIGRELLHYLSVSLSAFRIAGGALLFMVAADMVMARSHSGIRQTTLEEDREATQRADVTVFPLAVPLIAGPGALTTIILLQDTHAADPLARLVVALVMLLVLALVLAGFLGANAIMRVLGVTGVNVLGRVLGIVLAAIAANNIVVGLRDSFPGLAG